LPQLLEARHVVVSGYRAAIASVITEDQSMGCATEPGGGLNEGVEHGLQIESRAADHLEHVGRGGLLLQRFAQFLGTRAHLVEQPGVLDRDHRLVGEGPHEADLGSGEWFYLAPRAPDDADRGSLLN